LQQNENFASAVMMRLVAAGMKKQGIDMGRARPSGAHVPRSEKRSVLQKLEECYGSSAVLAISDAVADMPAEPVVAALRRATDLPDLLDRWHRVEVFSHGSHRVLSDQTKTNAFRLKHVSRSGKEQPLFVESLLVLSVMTRLAELTCRHPVMVAFGDGQVLRRDGVWQPVDLSRWDRAVTLLQSNALAARSPDPTEAHNFLDTCKALLLDDPVRRWSVNDLAELTGVSARTLQRRFTEQGVTFSELVSETRLEKAASYLCEIDGPGLPETGFLSGYSDQAHFSRSFKRHVGTTPRDYRTNFAA
jgi:AraC-like DNA-binding protein